MLSIERMVYMHSSEKMTLCCNSHDLSEDARLASVGWLIKIVDELSPDMMGSCICAADGTVVPFEIATEYVYRMLLER